MSEDSFLADLPDNLRSLRACLRCHLIKTVKQWRQNSHCENCQSAGGLDSLSFTTPLFKGMIAMMQPQHSWVARWQRQERRVRGIYAMQVYGEMPKDEFEGEEEELNDNEAAERRRQEEEEEEADRNFIAEDDEVEMQDDDDKRTTKQSRQQHRQVDSEAEEQQSSDADELQAALTGRIDEAANQENEDEEEAEATDD